LFRKRKQTVTKNKDLKNKFVIQENKKQRNLNKQGDGKLKKKILEQRLQKGNDGFDKS